MSQILYMKNIASWNVTQMKDYHELYGFLLLHVNVVAKADKFSLTTETLLLSLMCCKAKVKFTNINPLHVLEK